MSRNQSASAKRQARNLSCLQGMPLISIRGGCHERERGGEQSWWLSPNSFEGGCQIKEMNKLAIIDLCHIAVADLLLYFS